MIGSLLVAVDYEQHESDHIYCILLVAMETSTNS